MPEQTPPPPLTLAGSTFRCYRLTPLHSTTASASSSSSSTTSTTTKQTDKQPPLSTPQNLTHHANRFASFVRGDVLRGVRIAEDVNRNIESCTFEPFTISTPAPSSSSSSRNSPTTDNGGVEGIAVTLKFARGSYNAFLLKNSHPSTTTPDRDNEGNKGSRSRSIWYPLLLTRMPAGLLSVFTEYIGAHFDTHVSALRITGGGGGDKVVNGFMRGVLEGYIRNTLCRTEGGGREEVKRDIQMVFEPPGLSTNTDEDGNGNEDGEGGGDIEKEFKKVVEGGVKAEKTKKMTTLSALTLTVAKGDVLNFEKVGKRILKDTSSQNKTTRRNGEEEGGGGGGVEQPFMAGFEHYALEVLGVHLEKMTLAKVSCADFVLAVHGADGSVRCKFFDGGVGSVRRVGEEVVDDDDEDDAGAGGCDWKGLLDELLGRATTQL